MSLFGFGRKKESGKAVPACCCAGEAAHDCCSGAAESVRRVMVLGAGCAACHQQYDYAREAAKNIGLSVEVEYITDMQKIMEYGVMSMPAIVVNERVVSMGRVLKTTQVEKLLRNPEV